MPKNDNGILAIICCFNICDFRLLLQEPVTYLRLFEQDDRIHLISIQFGT